MEEIRAIDRQLWIKECLAAGRLAGLGIILLILYGLGQLTGRWLELAFFMVAALAWVAFRAHESSVQKRFRYSRFSGLWRGCEDRLSRFKEVVGRMPKEAALNLNDMPRQIRRVGDELYIALRRADIIAHEVQATEHGIIFQPPVWIANPSDRHTKDLYQMADRNIAEYRQHYDGVMAGVNRVEAQCAVFMTTLDTVRMKLIGYSLVGRAPEVQNDDFLAAMGDANQQLEAIDKALKELDFFTLPDSSPPPFSLTQD